MEKIHEEVIRRYCTFIGIVKDLYFNKGKSVEHIATQTKKSVDEVNKALEIIRKADENRKNENVN